MRNWILAFTAIGALAVGFTAARASAATASEGVTQADDCYPAGFMVCDPNNHSDNCKYCGSCCNGCDPKTCNGNYCFCS
jgi:hypothetical protein